MNIVHQIPEDKEVGGGRVEDTAKGVISALPVGREGEMGQLSY